MELALNTMSANEPIRNGTVNGLTRTDAGNNEVNLLKGTDTIGRGSAGKLTINVKGSDGVA